MHVLIPALHRPTKPTGVCRHAVNLAQCLADHDHIERVTLLIGDWQREYFEQVFNLNSPKIELIDVEIKNSSIARNLWFLFGLPKLAQQLQPDVVHMSFPFPFVRQWFQGNVVATIHDLYPYECPDNFGYPQVWFNQLFLQQCIHNSDGLINVSNCTLESLKAYFPKVKAKKKAAVVYNVVEFSDVDSRSPHQLEQELSAPFLMTVAQHRKNKNLNLLIAAYGQLLNHHKLPENSRLLLIGSTGPETDSLKALVQDLKLEENVYFLSGLTDEELRWLYEHAALFVIPSSTEGFCLPLVEAVTFGCPAVCSDIPIFREVGSSQCRYFSLEESTAVENLSQAMADELAETSRQDNFVDHRFSRHEISGQLLNFYLSLAHAKAIAHKWNPN